MTLLDDYSCSPTWFIHNLARIIYYCALCCCYNLNSYYFLYNNEKLTFLWHLNISNCFCLLFILFYLKLIHSYTSVWTNIILVTILVNIFIDLLVVYILYYYFTVSFSKSYFLCDIWVFLTLRVDYSCSPTWSIHTHARFIYYCSLYCCYNLYSYYFLYIYEKLTFFVTLEHF